MFFSLIVVSLNSGEKLKKSLESALSQSFTDFEIILKDGNSTDDSFDRARELLKDPRIKVYRESDKGIYDAMNQAVQYASGDYVYFLNCGDYLYDTDTLQKVAEAIQKDGRENLILYGNMYHQYTEAIVTHSPVIDGFTCYRNVPCHQACFFPRSLCRKKPFDISYKIRADYEHFLWCFYHGKASFFYLPEVLASYEGGGFSETKENKKCSKREHSRITEYYMTSGELFRYKAILFLTLAPLRTRMADSKHFSKLYNGIRAFVYRIKA